MSNDSPDKTAEDENQNIETVELFIFKIMDVYFGADMEQIEEMIEVPSDAGVGEIMAIHKLIPFRATIVTYQTPKVLLVKDEKEGAWPLMIDQAKTIVNLSIDSIQLFPGLMEGSRKSEALWGATFIDENLVLLVDLNKLSTLRPSQSKSS